MSAKMQNYVEETLEATHATTSTELKETTTMPTICARPMPNITTTTTTTNANATNETTTTTTPTNNNNNDSNLLNNLNSNLNNLNNKTTIQITDNVVVPQSSVFVKAANLTARSGLGVQNLRNLWNQRIMENEVLQQQQQQQQLQNSDKRTQSISCLNSIFSKNNSNNININNINNTPTNNNNLQLSKRAQSLHDCTNIEFASIMRERDRLQREKDNFYKYKTAEQAAKHRRSDTNRTSQLLTRRFTVSGTSEDEEIATTPTTTTTNTIEPQVFYSTKITINEADSQPQAPPLPPPRATKQQKCAIAAEQLEDTSTEKTTTNSAVSRRYSFKTHIKCYPLGGKLSKEATANNAGNIVARLTQQFNDIIQNDRKLLDEVKRKNGVLMARGGHVYKVLENTERNKSVALKRNNSSRASTVQKQIQRFEVEVQKNDTKIVQETADNSEPEPELELNTVTDTLTAEAQQILNENDAKSKKSKNKYAKIYEKFRIRSPFSSPKSNNKKQQQNDKNLEKILTALQEVDQKLKGLTVAEEEEEQEPLSLVSLHENNDFEQVVLPNTSFVHQTNKLSSDANITQAVNVTLVNSLNTKNELEQTECNITQIEQDSLYEPIADLKPNNDDIYQTVKEALMCKEEIMDDYESIADVTEHHDMLLHDDVGFDNYETLELCPPAVPPPPVPTLYTQLSRNTNDELPELPKPKRRLPKSPMPGKRLIKPQQSEKENIYCTIKNASECYEPLRTRENCVQAINITAIKTADTISLESNGYERINNYRRSTHISDNKCAISHCGSMLTICSDHKTNSLYEPSLAASLLHNGHADSDHLDAQSFLVHPSFNARLSVCSNLSNSTIICERKTSSHSQSGSAEAVALAASSYSLLNMAASDNSDDWIDMTDTDEASSYAKISTPQFIVVRERFKVHRSPDWSKRVRDKRLHQNKAITYTEDDSDHYYETLSPLNNAQCQLAQQNQQTTSNSCAAAAAATALPTSTTGIVAASDEYDSFDTDTDDVAEIEDFKKHQNDSGVDMSHVRLPEPPTSTNQVYAIVRKFKNFISSKKVRHNVAGRLTGTTAEQQSNKTHKLYENTAQFYVCNSNTENAYENTPKLSKSAVKASSKNSKKSLAQAAEEDEAYENTEFHTLRTKAKASESFKLRLRKSLIIDAADSKAATAAHTSPTRNSTFYVDDIKAMDSGFSDKSNNNNNDNDNNSDNNNTDATLNVSETHKFSTVARKSKKAAKKLNMQRRRTTIGIRPHEPPPPPPAAAADARPVSTTLWYAECGVFKNGNAYNEQPRNKATASYNGSHSSWYAEAGLYNTSGTLSVASSSGSSGVSTGNEAGLGDEHAHSMFENEPLYQIYNAAKLESISRDMDMETDRRSTDGYEEIGQAASSKEQKRPSALQLVGPKQGPARTLWSEITEVINSCILSTLTARERALQEAKFEIITSEASYLKSLNMLRTHYMNHPLFRDTSVVSARDRKALFGYIIPVHECSERLLTELEQCWQDNIMLLGLSKRIFTAAEQHFHVYVAFCEQQGRMDRTLRRLKEAKHSLFAQNLELLEMSPTCCGLNLHSFLMLPMQRITRLPLLIDAVFSKMQPTDDEYDSWKMTLAIMNKLVTQCNEAANACEQAYEIERISRQLEFPSSIRALAIAPVGVAKPGAKPRFLVKRGELTQLIWRGDDIKLTFGKKFSKMSIYVFLFSDLLVLTKRKNEQQFTVFDYCARNMLTIAAGDALPQLPTKDIGQMQCKNLILMTLLENHEHKTVELLLSCPSVSEQERWLTAMRPVSAALPGEKLYEQWDCPQVIAKHAFVSNEPDALNLDMGDVVNVTRKLADGWFEGERIRDGAVGWFPGSYTDEVNSAHVRARNLKQRYRLLTFTATYLESQKRK